MRLRFERFVLDPDDRLLTRDGAAVELNARYLDALCLLAREHGRLVSKDRFLEEVWRGVPVTDEALTQCIRTLRKQLGDNAARPRFIETVPKHGYRFIAPVEAAPDAATGKADATSGPAAHPAAELAGPSTSAPGFPWRRVALLGAAGAAGGGGAGVLGGLFYSLVATAQSQAGAGAASALLVLVCLTALVGLAGGAGVGFGAAAAAAVFRRQWLWSALGGAGGGLAVGAVAKLLGVDAFNLLFGRSPGDITGGLEGALLGGAVGLGVWLAGAGPRLSKRRIAAAGLVAGAAGVLIHVLGGRLMAGSLDLLAGQFPDSRLRLDRIGALFGEPGFGPVSQAVVGGLEGMLFGAWVAGAMALARRRLDPNMTRPDERPA